MPPPKGSNNRLEGPGDYDVTKTVHSDTYDAIDPTRLDLSGKAVFVSGGTKGIGKEITLSFVRAGVSYLAVGARNIDTAKESLAEEIKSIAEKSGKKSPQFLPVKLDVSDAASVTKAAAETEAAFGRLDILVNNAGVVGSFEKVAESDPEGWWNVMDVNVRGPYLVTRAFLPLLIRSPSGLKTISNTSSVGAHIISHGLSHYQISKLALVRFSEFIASEYADEGVICFSIHPGNVVTKILGPNGIPEELKHVFVDTPRLAGDTVVYLTSERRQWLSGRYVNVTWDMPELEAKKEEIVSGDKLKVKLVC
jgi:NAD(P)-dependent dehydrogenase (short-subunit alcohol dehydrogenase family)